MVDPDCRKSYYLERGLSEDDYNKREELRAKKKQDKESKKKLLEENPELRRRAEERRAKAQERRLQKKEEKKAQAAQCDNNPKESKPKKSKMSYEELKAYDEHFKAYKPKDENAEFTDDDLGDYVKYIKSFKWRG
jgi:hypothetical protein